MSNKAKCDFCHIKKEVKLYEHKKTRDTRLVCDRCFSILKKIMGVSLNQIEGGNQ